MAEVVWLYVGVATTVVRGERLEDAPTPTPRQQQMQNGTVNTSIQHINPNIEPITAPTITPTETEEFSHVSEVVVYTSEYVDE